MNPIAIAKANSRLRVAKKAVAELTSDVSYESFVDLWYTFLTASKNIWTILEKGAKSSPQSRQWYGGITNQRKKDPLLQYIYQARSDDEHGLAPIAKPVYEDLQVGGGGPGFAEGLSISKKPCGPMLIKVLDGKPLSIRYTPRHIQLVRVHGRDRTPYDPPTEHLGLKLNDNLPVTVATKAVLYLESLINAAGALA